MSFASVHPIGCVTRRCGICPADRDHARSPRPALSRTGAGLPAVPAPGAARGVNATFLVPPLQGEQMLRPMLSNLLWNSSAF